MAISLGVYHIFRYTHVASYLSSAVTENNQPPTRQPVLCSGHLPCWRVNILNTGLPESKVHLQLYGIFMSYQWNIHGIVLEKSDYDLPSIVMTNIAMENYPISSMVYGLPIKNGDFPWQTVSHNQMVTLDTMGFDLDG